MTDPLTPLVHEHMLMQRHAVYGGAPHGRQAQIDRSATLLLARLEDEGPMTVSSLAEAFGLDISTVHRQLAAAIKNGLIEKIRDPDGGAARLHRPSAEGRQRLAEELAARRESFQRITNDWDVDEVRNFTAMMRRFNEKVEALKGQPWPRGDLPIKEDPRN